MAFTNTATHDTTYAPTAADDSLENRLAFLRKVYTLFGCSMVTWMGTALLVSKSEAMLSAVMNIFGNGFIGLLLFMALLFGLLHLTRKTSAPINYIGLGLFSVLEGFLTAPLIYYALAATGGENLSLLSASNVVTQAFVLTGIVFGGLTVYALTTKRDFSFMRGALWMGFFLLFGLGILAMFGIGESMQMGWGISVAWIVLMGGFVLYDTQNILKTYPSNMAAAAAATLMIDFIIMFQRILMLLSRRD
ncbi:MAG: Bax inhibitor-1 family protein [Planctomycetota bacterium]|jgi:FtsH-binding integral membrane protein|nr:Bax inhibitor-1 family protein [Planctomycetota bacterium]